MNASRTTILTSVVREAGVVADAPRPAGEHALAPPLRLTAIHIAAILQARNLVFAETDAVVGT